MRIVWNVVMKFLCLFGHDKEYVALRKAEIKVQCRSSACCSKMWHDVPVLEARWSCRKCGKLGYKVLKEGAWKIEFGKLLPDAKAWANWEGL